MKNKYRNTNSSIKCGDLVLTEQPFAFILSSKEKGSRCDNCMQKLKVLKCSGCQFVHYCGRLCQKEAWVDHKWECGNFKRIAPKVLPDGARMLSKIINRLTRGDGHQVRAFYSPNSFRMWKDLMSHYSDLKSDTKRMEHFISLCGVLHEFLKDISLPNNVEMMGLYGRMVINSFNILDTDMNSIGTGVYLAASTMDHSCEPNAVATFDGKTLNVRAVKDMPNMDWRQIRISYIDLMKTPYERQSELLSNYYFLCQCDRCMDETQLKYIHAAKCLNNECNAPVTVKWKEDLQLVRIDKQENVTIENGENCDEIHREVFEGVRCEECGTKYSDEYIDRFVKAMELTEVHLKNMQGASVALKWKEDLQLVRIDKQENVTIENGENCDEIHREVFEGVRCEECGTKYSDEYIDRFVKAMELTEVHLKNMQGASVAYVDVCKYCLDRHEGVLHPLNVAHAQTLEHAFDALIQMQLWDKACECASKLIPCFRFYYGDMNPLLGLLFLKYGKILLYKSDVSNALIQLKQAEKILKNTHGEKHPLYKEQLVPLLQQAIVETS